MAWEFASLLAGGPAVNAVLGDRITLCADRRFFLPPSDVVVSDADDHELQVFWAFESGRVCEVPPISIFCLEDVVLLPEGVVVLPSGEVLLESIHPYTPQNYAGRFSGSLELYRGTEDLETLRRGLRVFDDLVHLREPGETGYFHWMNSVLPRLVVTERVMSLGSLPLALNVWPMFARDSLERLGLQERQTYVSAKPLQVGQLWFPTPCVTRGDHFTRPPFYSRELRRHLLPQPAQQGDLVYLSRGDAKVRRIRNEDAVMDLVGRLGFEVVTVGEMPFAEQAALFSRARVLLSPHGAGLSNALFMQTGLVGEIVSRNRPWPTFRTLAGRLDLGYGAFMARFDPAQTETAGEGNEDLEVDLSRFAGFCDRLVRAADARSR